jgi:hypothetical protein
MKPTRAWIALGASLALACGSDHAPGDEAAGGSSAVAGHAGVSAPAAGSSVGGVGGAAAGGKASGAGAPGQSGGGATGVAATTGAVDGGGGNTAGSSTGGAGAAGQGSAGATLGGAAGATAAGAAGTSGHAEGGSAMTTGGRDGAGGAPLGGGAGIGGSGMTGAGGDAAGPFRCNQVTGGQLVEEWFIAGFEKVVDEPRWQVKWRVDGYLEEWANPQSSFWTAPVDSKCANDTDSPDRIVFPVVSFMSRSRPDWVKTIEQAITTFKGKYSGIRRMDLMTQVRGPDNMLCPTAPTQGETIVVPPELDDAIDDVAAAHPGFVFVGPRVEARSCSDIQGGGPHLTSAGNTAAAVPISSYFVAAE